MELLHLLFICSSLATALAYPADYNETTDTIAREALSHLRSLVALNPYPSQLEIYNNRILSAVEATYEEMDANYEQFIQRLVQVQESAADANVDVTTCLEKYPVITPERYYENFNEDCVVPADEFGVNLNKFADGRNWEIFARRYEELMHSFSGCMSPGDPAPYICEGVIAATLQEIGRIQPLVEVFPLQVQRLFDQQIFALSKCSSEHISILSSRLQVQFVNAKTCVLNEINIA